MNRDIVFPNNGRGHLINVNVKCYVPGKMWVWKYPYIGEDGYWYYWDEAAGGVIRSDEPARGPEGPDGPEGPAGRGIVSIEKTSTVGSVDTYTITYTSGPSQTFTVTNGSVFLDPTLSQEGQAADAAAVGQALAELDGKFVKIYDCAVGGYSMQYDLDLEIGDVCYTRGYYEPGDGGAAFYKITGTVDYVGYIPLLNNWFANLIDKSTRLNVLRLGFWRDGVHDNHDKMMDVLQWKNTDANYKVPLTLYFPPGLYAFSPTQIQSWGLVLEGEGNPFPTNSRFLCTVFMPTGDSPDWVQPVYDPDTEDYDRELIMYTPAYMKGHIVSHNNKNWKSLVGYNHSEPGTTVTKTVIIVDPVTGDEEEVQQEVSEWEETDIEQEYIIMLGSDDQKQFRNGWTYHGNAIKNIQFCCNKPGTDSRYGTANNYKVGSALVINRQYMAQFYDLAFYYCYGSGLKMASSWECLFTTLMFRNILAPDKGAFCLATDVLLGSGTLASDISSNHFDNIEFESIVGPYMDFESDCDFENNHINSIIVEDYRLDMPSREQTAGWGTKWTVGTWMPAGKTAPDVELGIFNFEEGSEYSNNTIGAITASMYAVRSYWYVDWVDGVAIPSEGYTTVIIDGNEVMVPDVVYTHNAIVKCSGFPKLLDFQCGMVNVQLNKTDVKTLIFHFPWTPDDFNFTIDSAIMNSNDYVYRLDGVCRNYCVIDRRLRKSIEYDHVGYIDAYPTCIDTSVYELIENDAVDGATIKCYPPLGKYTDESYAKNKIAHMLPDRSVFNATKGMIRLPVMGKILHARIYQEAAHSVFYRVCDADGNSIRASEFPVSQAGWSWQVVDLSNYLDDLPNILDDGNFVTILNREDAVNASSNLVDVMYWSF